MLPVSSSAIRSSFINATRSEAAKLTPPRNLATLDWDGLDVLGWRDEKMPLRGYLVAPTDRGLTGILLRAPEGGARKNRSVLCELCRDVYSKEDVLLWVARRAGQSGRDGNSVGTLICADFVCSSNVRRRLPRARSTRTPPSSCAARSPDSRTGPRSSWTACGGSSPVGGPGPGAGPPTWSAGPAWSRRRDTGVRPSRRRHGASTPPGRYACWANLEQ